MKKVISVIVPLYFGKCYIESMISQMEKCAGMAKEHEIQLVLSNDAPEERIEDIFDSSRISIKIVNADYNGGIHKARIKGLENSDGDYILFLDQDDKIKQNYFASQLEKIGTADAVVCGAVSGGRIKYDVDRPLDKAVSRNSMIKEGNMILSPGQVLLRRGAIPHSWRKNVMQHNGADDWLLWLCMHLENRKFAINEENLFIREVHYGNASFDSQKMTASEREAVEIIDQEYSLCTEERRSLRELLPKLTENRMRENQKWKKMFLILNDWFLICSQGGSIADYLKGKGLKKIAVYGYGYLGRALCEDLKRENADISYVIDRNADFLETDYKCCTIDGASEGADAVIVTLVSEDRNEIKGRLKEKFSGQILWLEDIIIHMLKNEQGGVIHKC